MKFDLRLALAHWHGEPDGTALVTLDGLVLKFTLRQLWLLVACPAGEAPHEAPLVDLKSLANLILASQVDPTLPPWGCPHTCPSAGNTPLHVGGEPRLRSVAADSGA